MQGQRAGGHASRGSQQVSDLDVVFPGEEVIIDARPAWSAWAGQLLIAGLVVLFGLISGEQAALGITVVIGLIILANVWYQRRKVRYVVTDQRILVLTGISSKKTNEAWLDDVKGMQTGASFIERFLGHGHITVSRDILPRGSALPLSTFIPATGNGMTLGGIANYEQIASIIRERQAEQKGVA